MSGHWGYEGSLGDRDGRTAATRSVGADPTASPGISPEDRKGVHGYAIDGGARPHDVSRSKLTSEPDGPPPRDPTLQHPRCVFQILKRHFSRYTPEMVSQVCGCSPEQFTRVAELLCANSGRERTSVLVYALGWTQHATGAQMIRAGGILQLLLGNIGRPGGGILAMRGHSSIQGSTDVGTLYDVLPGYLPQPAADGAHDTLDSYVAHDGMATGYWSHFRADIVSLLKAWYGDAARPENDFRYDWLPRIERDHSQLPTFNRMSRGELTGYFLFGQNPGGGGLNAGLHRAGLRNLEWLVVADWFETESVTFWKNDPGAPPPSEIKTEVFVLPAAANPETDGTLTNTQRLLQWHCKAIDPPGDCRSDSWFVYNLGKRLKRLYAGSTDPKDQPLLEPHLGLRLRRTAAAPRRLDQSHRERRRRRKSPDGDERVQARRGRPTHRPAAPAQGLLGTEGRRHDGLRHLDLQRRLPRARSQPGARAQAIRQSARAGLGIRLAR